MAEKESLLKTLKRDYYSCTLVEFKFRGIPQRVSQQSHYSFGGRAEVSFKSYVLNSDELEKLEEELKASDTEDVFKLIEGSTGESLEKIQDEINYFLEEKDESQENENEDRSNPFVALIGGYEKKQEKEDKKENPAEKKIWWPGKESFIEETSLRPLAEEKAKEMAFRIFDVYKKAHGMASYT